MLTTRNYKHPLKYFPPSIFRQRGVRPPRRRQDTLPGFQDPVRGRGRPRRLPGPWIPRRLRRQDRPQADTARASSCRIFDTREGQTEDPEGRLPLRRRQPPRHRRPAGGEARARRSQHQRVADIHRRVTGENEKANDMKFLYRHQTAQRDYRKS